MLAPSIQKTLESAAVKSPGNHQRTINKNESLMFQITPVEEEQEEENENK